MAVFIRETCFFPCQELEAYERKLGGDARAFGAMAMFVGSMRDVNLGEAVTRMELEYYPGMTEKQLEKIVDEARLSWEVLDVLVIHRVGEIFPNDSIVLVAVWSLHRGPAFDACRHIMEELKHRAPFWKKETLECAEERWVDRNTDGYGICPPQT